jgi:signal peptidase II
VRVRALARALLVLALVVGLDQLTKHTLGTSVAAGEQRKFLPGIALVHVRNTGVAFGFLTGGGAIVLALTFAALLVLVCYLALRPQRQLLWLPTGMLLGGAIGNLIDRLARGSVIDFIKLPLWPAFNVADISITFGVVALLWVLEGPSKQRD